MKQFFINAANALWYLLLYALMGIKIAAEFFVQMATFFILICAAFYLFVGGFGGIIDLVFQTQWIETSYIREFHAILQFTIYVVAILLGGIATQLFKKFVENN